MKHSWIVLAATLSLAPSAWADNVAHCEALIMQVVPNEDNTGEAQIASFRSAVPFLASLYDQEEGHMSEIDGFPIQAIMCRRNNIIPSETDGDILATGIPFALSQDFDSPDTDSLTLYWKAGKIKHVYKGNPLSEESQAILDTRLAEFSTHGLNASARQADEQLIEVEVEVEVEDKVDLVQNLDIEIIDIEIEK